VDWKRIEFDNVDVDTVQIGEHHHIKVRVTLNAEVPFEWARFFIEAAGFPTLGAIDWRFDDERLTVTTSPRIDPAGLWVEDFTARAHAANRRYEHDVLGLP
jgi:hypothetical protein